MVDISDFRQVPDNQEVFADTTDRSLIIEILESTPHTNLQSAAEFHFSEIVEANDASSSEVLQTKELSGTTCMVVGKQTVGKFNEAGKGMENAVYVAVALVRVAEHSADILITLNVPYMIAPGSSSGSQAVVEPVDVTVVASEFEQLVETFTITDLGIFG
ncbi:hypothetical protein FBU59_001339 [Linderina macrospora]|uniref:Uncharacterized protein n=1 Tax=Linderina macrospora TaxID=4868 RepID=A0ACC1JEE0_9FUNG|nr:hypothetical protein FBU59_001339 [Linderina macrospora]